MLIGIDIVEHSNECLLCHDEVEEALDNVISADCGAVLHKIFAQVSTGVFRFLVRCLQQWERDKRQVALEVGTCFLQLNHLSRHILSVERLHCLDGSSLNL